MTREFESTMENPWIRPTGQLPLLIAHRGGRGPWRENTLEAFAEARSQGAQGVELDVRLSADRQLVVVHDPAIAGVGEVHALPKAQLPPWVPTLAEALDVCDGLVVDVEIKVRIEAPEEAAALAQATMDVVCAALGAEDGPRAVLVSSFWPDALVQAQKRGQPMPTLGFGLLVHPAFDPSQAAHQASKEGWDVLLPFHSACTRDLVDECHGLKIGVWTWTANSREDLAAVSGAGVDAVISDEVERGISVLKGVEPEAGSA